MEIEARFRVPDAASFRKLKSATNLGGFAVSKGKSERVRDTYLDTRDNSLLAAGYALRRRKQGRNLVITVKKLRSSNGAISRRVELEIKLKKDSPPARWPPGRVRGLVLRISRGEPLIPLVEFRQTRFVRSVTRNGRKVAEMSLDRVRVGGDKQAPAYYEVECERKSGGTGRDIEAIADVLEKDWNLSPDRRSKFEHALASANFPGTKT